MSRKKWALALVLALVVGGAAWWLSGTSRQAPPPQAAAEYVGASTCASCHAAEQKAWLGSHHELAMQEANAATVLGNFDGARFAHHGVESTFFKRDGKFVVRTDGPDGKLADFEIKYTFGVSPLQQYLIEFPGGRYQALGIAWDARPKAEGGQRWFHLYPNEKIDHRDALHWTGLYQNWNLQCAACHSTNLKKGYDAAGNAYRTTFSEINVACEACHGPGSRHVEWAKKRQALVFALAGDGQGAARPEEPLERGLEVRAGRTRASRSATGPPTMPLMNVCAACHARRSTIAESGRPGAPLEDTHRLALLTAPNYYADGQQREEVYVWGSFLQTRMHQRGVTCMDCHEPHASKLRAEGNALCLRCHQAAAFDTEKHHFHKAGTAGAQCVECHMPARNYMVVDARRDHAIRVPRPDLSLSLGSPNACTQCHAGRDAGWAAAAMDRWYGKAWRDRPQFGTALHAGATQGAKSLPALLALAGDPAFPPIVRASAATLAGPYVRPQHLPAARRLLGDFDPGVRIAALGLVAPFEPGRARAGGRAAARRPGARRARRGRARSRRCSGRSPHAGAAREPRESDGRIRRIAAPGFRLAGRQRQPRQPADAPGPRRGGDRRLPARAFARRALHGRVRQPRRRLPHARARGRGRESPAARPRAAVALGGPAPCAGPVAGAQGRQGRAALRSSRRRLGSRPTTRATATCTRWRCIPPASAAKPWRRCARPMPGTRTIPPSLAR